MRKVLSDTNIILDIVQVSAAELHNLDLILTRNIDDFSESSLKVLTPKAFISTVSR